MYHKCAFTRAENFSFQHVCLSMQWQLLRQGNSVRTATYSDARCNWSRNRRQACTATPSSPILDEAIRVTAAASLSQCSWMALSPSSTFLSPTLNTLSFFPLLLSPLILSPSAFATRRSSLHTRSIEGPFAPGFPLFASWHFSNFVQPCGPITDLRDGMVL